MSCWGGSDYIDMTDFKGYCPSCDQPVDKDGKALDSGCSYSPISCEDCGYHGCDGSC